VIAAVMTIEDDIAFLERVPILRRLGAGALRILDPMIAGPKGGPSSDMQGYEG